MKKIVYSIISLGLALGLSSCQPEINVPETSAAPITSVTATVQYKGEYLDFTAYPKEGSEIIEIEFPWFYPLDSDNRLPLSLLTDAKMTAVLANNVVIKEPLLRMDLTELVLSDEIGLSTMIKNQTNQIAILTDGLAGKGNAVATISPHATISPDPATEEIDFDDPNLVFTVTAHNGKDKKQYTIIKEIPPKRPFGLRPGSGKVIFEKQLYADLNIDVADKTTGLAVNGTNLIINTQGQNPLVIDRYTGEKVGSMAIGDLASSVANFYMTSDNDGNILFCNFKADDNIFKIWVSKDLNTTPEEFISWNTEGAMYGKKMSVSGSLDKNAVISVPVIAAGANSFARWVVTDGELVSADPEIVKIDEVAVWSWNCDVCYSGDTPDSDYFLHGYSGIELSWVGSNNKVKAALDPMSRNFVPNVVDVITFNRGMYVATTQNNGQPWGGCDYAWLLEISTVDDFTGCLNPHADDGAEAAEKAKPIFWESEYNRYGIRYIQGVPGASFLVTQNPENYADAILAPSTENDYYMYMYFMFCNGYVVGVQFDCLDM